MDNGEFNKAHPDIVKVSYVEIDGDGNRVIDTPTVSPASPGETEAPAAARVVESDGDDDRNLLLPLLLVGGAVLIVVTGIITYRNTS